MELLKEIYEKSIGISEKAIEGEYKVRKAARAIVYNNLGKIALLYVSKNNYHKLPGGGLEEGEDIKTALEREVLEEVGANIEVVGEIGCIIEYRNEFKQIQLSYCYNSKVIGEVKHTDFTEKEIEEGFKLKWVKLNEAIELLENDIPDNYAGKFMRYRDLIFLRSTPKI